MDNLLIYLIQSFNYEAFQILFNKYYRYSKIWAKELIKIYGYNLNELDSLECDIINNLYHAIESYDCSKGVFYSYIKRAVNFTVKNYFREYFKFNSTNVFSLESKVEDEINLIYIIPSDDNMSKIVERYYVLEEVETVINRIELFKDEEQIVIRLKMQGYSNDEISRMTGFSNRQVIYILTKFKKV